MPSATKYSPDVWACFDTLEGTWAQKAARLNDIFQTDCFTYSGLRQAAVARGKGNAGAVSSHVKASRESRSIEKFLTRGRTAPEIAEYLHIAEGDVLGELQREREGLTLFTTRNQYNQPLYVLLPEPAAEVEILPRIWDYRLCDGGEDPYYMWAQLKDKGECVRIIPLYDVHLGHRAHKREKFLSTLRYIAETDAVYTMLGGDLMENALDDGRGMSYDQDDDPRGQIGELVRLLAPVAHKILFAIPGNHELRTKKRAGIDPMEFIAHSLNVPYFPGPVSVDFLWKGHRWPSYFMHGYGNSQTKGGKANSAGRPHKFNDFRCFIVSGHVHDSDVSAETVRVADPGEGRMLHKTRYTVICPSYLGWAGTYAHEAGYAPPSKGGTGLILYSNGDYRAEMTPS